MIIYQVHSVHGHTMAQTSIEAKNNEDNGWKTITEEEFYDRGKKVSEEKDSQEESIHEEGISEIFEAGQSEPGDSDDSAGDSGGSGDLSLSRDQLDELYFTTFGKKADGRKSDQRIINEIEEATK